MILFKENHRFSSVYIGVERAISLARQADIIAALSTEALRGTVRHLHPSQCFFFLDVFLSTSFH